MKTLFTCITLLAFFPSLDILAPATKPFPFKPAGNLFIITTDGFRWQEVFNGADSSLINDVRVTEDTATEKMLYWDNNPIERRKKLMPFLWTIINNKGQLYGNRFYDNKVNVSNAFSISYPGYNEIFTGIADPAIGSNEKHHNPNINVLEYLDSKPAFKGKVAAFTSWDVFPYILNKERNGLIVNSGNEKFASPDIAETQTLINKVQDASIYDKTATRYDQLTFLTAKEYVRHYQPKVMYLGLGETDEAAHAGRYDLYLESANKVDRMIAELWHWVQTTPGYKDNTTFIITTDHGRGKKPGKWTSHGAFISGSSQTWLAVIGPGIEALGEMKKDQQIYQRQLAETMAELVGESFGPNTTLALHGSEQ